MINARPYAVALVTAVVAGLLTLVAGVAPATAATTYNTHVVLTTSSTPGTETYSFYPQAQVYVDGAPAGSTLPSGPMQLQRRDAGSSVWQTVATGSSSQAFGAKPEWFLTHYTGNATYRVYYQGGEDGWGSGTTWNPSYSNEVSVQVYRHDVGVPHNRGARAWIQGSLTNWAHKRVLVQQRRCNACGWHVYARPLTNSAGSYKLRVKTSRKGLHYRVTVKANTQFLKTRSPVLQARIL